MKSFEEQGAGYVSEALFGFGPHLFFLRRFEFFESFEKLRHFAPPETPQFFLVLRRPTLVIFFRLKSLLHS